MIEGRLGNTSGAPFVEARVTFPRLNVTGLVPFLVDTGADGTLFMPADSRKIGIDFGNLKNPTTSSGIGGPARGFLERVIISFSDRRYVFAYLLKAEIAVPTRHNSRLPSLLGRDVLRQWRFVLDPTKGKVSFTPRTWTVRAKI
jgi:predicted aspartyl protease